MKVPQSKAAKALYELNESMRATAKPGFSGFGLLWRILEPEMPHLIEMVENNPEAQKQVEDIFGRIARSFTDAEKDEPSTAG